MSNIVEIWPNIECGLNNREQVRALPTSILKRMWDDNSNRWEFLWEDIHAEMNERGEGAYVAV